MKILIVSLILLVFVGCGNKKNNPNTELASDTVSVHAAESEIFNSNERVVFSENIYFKINDEIRITENLEGNYSSPKFTPDGKKLLFTNAAYSEIWMYDIEQKEIQQISSLPGSGYKFSISEDASNVYFRNKTLEANTKRSKSSIIEHSLEKNNHNIIHVSESSLSPPFVISELLFFAENENIKCFDLTVKKFISDTEIPFLFIKENNLFKYKYGRIFNLNETKNNFVDLNYSIDRKYVRCLTRNNGVEVLDHEGNLIRIFKDAVALDFLRNSNLVIFNKESDDGLSIKKSELFFGLLNSDNIIKLENKHDEKRFQPSWSPIENKIAYTNESGVIKIVSFTIEKN